MQDGVAAGGGLLGLAGNGHVPKERHSAVGRDDGLIRGIANHPADFHTRVRQGMHRRASEEPPRTHHENAHGPVTLLRYLSSWRGPPSGPGTGRSKQIGATPATAGPRPQRAWR